MHIQYLGHSCFKLIGKDDKGNAVSLVTDPFGPEYGLRLPSVEADIVTVSHQHKDHNNVAGIKGKPYVIDTPGEYEVRDVFIQGIDSFHDDKSGTERGANIIYRISMEDMVITHLGDLGHTLDAKQIERLEGTDILFIPVGGRYTLNAAKAVEVINQIEPRMVIPMHYSVSGLKVELEGLDKFIKEIGMKPTEEEKLKITKKDLPVEDMELVVLKS
jgi:L-ascorbate metabolism protein UlaG (beta-lactamase superfamily)